ncbi:MAG TPA: efflux RND transporter periplasmic adaptor subunit [Chryseolinea sp.]|nr:efflux RND transporter periplasmic adaptor subunit [Chryseolinea sp.]
MKNIIILIVSTVLISACGNKTETIVNVADSTTLASSVTLTEIQYKAAGIAMGKIEKKEMGSSIQANGKLDVPPQNLISISAPLGGFVKSTILLQGMKVRKGDVLVVLENQDYIQLQQDYLDNKSKLEFAEAQYNRQTELAKENVNATKSLEQSKSEYESVRALVKGLEAKLTMINISPASLGEGSIRSTIKLYAPVDGFVSQVNVNIGQFVSPTDVMFKIVNLDHIHVELQIYEKDISKIATGQKVKFQLANASDVRTASVFLIGKEISAERTVNIHCHLDKEDPTLLPGMYVKGSIETALHKVDVVPNEALVNFEGDHFIFIPSGKNEFKIVAVGIGNSEGEFTEVKLEERFDRQSSIVTKGAFELLGVLKNTEEE